MAISECPSKLGPSPEQRSASSPPPSSMGSPSLSGRSREGVSMSPTARTPAPAFLRVSGSRSRAGASRVVKPVRVTGVNKLHRPYTTSSISIGSAPADPTRALIGSFGIPPPPDPGRNALANDRCLGAPRLQRVIKLFLDVSLYTTHSLESDSRLPAGCVPLGVHLRLPC